MKGKKLAVVPQLQAFELPVIDEALVSGAITASGKILVVNSPGSQLAAMTAAKTVKGLASTIEGIRVTLTKPVLTFKKKIDDICNSKITLLNNEASRISRLITTYTLVEQEKARLAQVAKDKEIQRLADEEAKKLARVKSPEKRAAIEAQTEAAVLAIEDPIAATPAPLGAALLSHPRFEITDIGLFYAAFPGLCKIDPLPGLINAEIRKGWQPDPKKGIRVWIEKATSIRSW